MSEPMKELGSRIVSDKIKNDENLLLAWMMRNVVARVDVKENVYPRKTRNENKMDGAVAAIIAMNRKLFFVREAESANANAKQIVI
jgi:phage terminase large subunit-like protein